MTLFIILCFVISVLLTWGMISLLLKFCANKGLYDQINARKVHRGNIPRLGGVAFLPSVFISVLITMLLMLNLGTIANVSVNMYTLEACLASAVVYVVGIYDDIWDCRASVKLFFQIASAALLPLSGFCINSLYGFCGIYELPLWCSYLLTIFFTLVIINAINLIDGIDGLAAMLVLFAVLVLEWEFARLELYQFCLAVGSLIGTLLVYLLYNIFGKEENGKKTFMGDSGSLFLGMVLSFLMLKLLKYEPELLPQKGNIFLLILSTVIVPCFDLVRVSLTRLKNGKALFVADKTHIHHKFMAKGLNMHKTLVAVVGLQVCFFVFNVLMYQLGIRMEWILLADILIYTLINIYLPVKSEKA